MSAPSAFKRFVSERLAVPHVYAIIFGLMLVAAAATYIVPAGSFDRVENEAGQEVVVDGSYQTVESSPAGLMDILTSVHAGMVEAAPIIFFIFIVGGSFGVFRATGTADAAVSRIAEKTKGREIIVIPLLMTFFAIGGAIFGLAEETIPYILIVTPLAIMLGYDSLVGAAIVLVGAASGFAAAFMNPFTIGVAQEISGLPIFSGLVPRLVFWAIFVSVGIAYVTWYAVRVRKNPHRSPMYNEDRERTDIEPAEAAPMGPRHIANVVVLLLTISILAGGVMLYGWYIPEISGLFLAMGLVMALIGGLGFTETAEAFIDGFLAMTMGALVIGLAYAVLTIMQNGNIMDTMINSMANSVSQLPTELSALGMYGAQSLTNFAVPSGSGQAALTMPIMAPLSDLVGVDRQTAVLAFQFGDGISNIFTPTSGYFMAALAAAGVSWVKWIQWIWPLLLMWYALGGVFVLVAHVFIWPYGG
ncbi:MAG: YfcC family protein [Nesterenkonia sp.]